MGHNYHRSSTVRADGRLATINLQAKTQPQTPLLLDRAIPLRRREARIDKISKTTSADSQCYSLGLLQPILSNL